MAIQTKTALKALFETGDQPTQADFVNVFDSRPNLHSAVADPTVNDDTGDGHEVGDLWINTDTPSLWVISDTTGGAAVWTDITSGGGDTLPIADTTAVVKGSGDASKLLRIEADGISAATTRVWTAQDVDGTVLVTGGADVAIGDGGTGQSTAQTAINALSAVGGATNEHVLTKDTGTGNAIFKAAAGGAPDAHKDSHDPEDGSDPLDAAAASEIAGVQAAGEGSSHSFARADHAHQIQHGITDNHLVTVDDADAANADYAKFTANGLEGRSFAEVKADLDLEIGTDVLAQQTIGIADNNLLEVDHISPADNDYAKFTANGLEGRSFAEVKSDLGLVIGTDVLAEQTIGIADDNLVEVDDADAADDDYAKFTASGLEGRSFSEVRTDINIADGADVTGSNAPQAHAASHQNAGGDEVSVAGLSGQLADEQIPIDHDHTGDAGDGGQLDLTNAVIGVLPVVNGGTNRGTAPKYPLMLTASGGMGTSTSGGGDTNNLPEQAETSGQKVNYHYLAMATDESVFWNVVMPLNWNAGTLTAIKIHWTAPSGSNDVKFEIKGRSFADNDALDQALGSAATVEDTLLANEDVHRADVSGPMTLAGTPAAGEYVVIEVKRVAPAGTDLVGDLHLLGVKMEYTATGYSES